MIFDKHDAENLQGAVVRLRISDDPVLLGHRAFDSCQTYSAYDTGINDKADVAFANLSDSTELHPDECDIVEVLKWPPGHPLAEMTPERAIEILADGHPLEEVRREALECLRQEVSNDWIYVNEAEPFPGQKILIWARAILWYSRWSDHHVCGAGGVGVAQTGEEMWFLRWKPVRP